MKKILIHIGGFHAGGAEKSLVSFLSTIPKDRYHIDILVYRCDGLFSTLVPNFVSVKEIPFPYKCLGVSLSNVEFYLKHNPKFLIKKILGLLAIKTSSRYSPPQVVWKLWKNTIPQYPEKYDVAISYIEGVTNYYVIDKVTAKKKILWVHNEYSKLRYSADFDYSYFCRADAVVTISQLCKDDLVNNFPSIKDKFKILQNIVNPNLIKELSDADIDDSSFNNCKSKYKILSIGRLCPQKNFELAIHAAEILKKNGFNFTWFIIGEGPLYGSLVALCKKLGVMDNFVFLGLKANPYFYIKHTDIFVMPSIFEGKSIALEEAKILCKPIVCTNFKTAFDAIENNITGIITNMQPQDMADSIYTVCTDCKLRDRLTSNLSKLQFDNTSEISNYIQLIGA